MKLVTVLNGVGSIGMFSSRAFVTAFVVAAALRWGPEIAWINDLGLLQQVKDVPTWFTHNLTLAILGLLAGFEVAATKSADARALLNEVDGYIKSGSAFVTYLAVAGVISAQDAALLNEITSELEPAAQAGIGNVLDFCFAALTGFGVFLAASARARLIGTFIQADPDDDSMLQWLLSWFEDIFAIFGTLLLILYPPFMLIVTGLVLGTLWLLEWRARRREEKSQVPCTSCGAPMYLAAVHCPSCDAPNPAVRDINWLGQSKAQTPAPDLKTHPQKLIAKQRCPRCASRLKPRQPRQDCERCGHALFREPAETGQYLAVLDRRVPEVLLISTALSLIPVIGLIPGIIYYRMRLVTPVARYTSMTRNLLTKWGIRLFYFVLIWVQLFPGIGAVVVPLMASMSYFTYRAMFQRQLELALAREQAKPVS